MSDMPITTTTAEPTAATTTAAPTTNSEAAWLSLINDPDIRGASETKGWDKLPLADAYQQAMKSYRNAERMLGAPADQLLRLPIRQDDEAGWRQVYQRLGAPEKPEDYNLKGLDFDDPDMTDRFADTVRRTAAEMNMPRDMAERMAQAFHKFVDDAGARTSAEQTAALQGEQDKLASDWGDPNTARFKANMFVADQAAEKLGLTEEARDKLKAGLGAAEVAKLFHKIGVAMGEDRYVANPNPNVAGVMSRDQAVAQKNELMADPQWVSRYLSGGAPEKRQMMALNQIIVGGE